MGGRGRRSRVEPTDEWEQVARSMRCLASSPITPSKQSLNQGGALGGAGSGRR